MKLLKYLNENVLNKLSDKEIIDLLKKDCQKFYKERGGDGTRIFRATNEKIEKIEKFKQKKTLRKPLDTPPEIHNFLDNELGKKFGWFVRSTAIFTQGNHANGLDWYGQEYYFFPIGEFKFVWNTKIDDFFIFLENWEIARKSGVGTWLNPGIKWEKIKSLIERKVLPYYIDKNLDKAIYSGHEIMFDCPNGYYMVDVPFVTKYYSEIIGKF